MSSYLETDSPIALVYYSGASTDGKIAAAVIKHAMLNWFWSKRKSPEVILVPLTPCSKPKYAEDFSWDKVDSVFFIGTCPSEPLLNYVLDKKRSSTKIEIFDHHLSSYETGDGFSKKFSRDVRYYYGENKSAATLAWSLMLPSLEVPKIVLDAEDIELLSEDNVDAHYLNIMINISDPKKIIQEIITLFDDDKYENELSVIKPENNSGPRYSKKLIFSRQT